MTTITLEVPDDLAAQLKVRSCSFAYADTRGFEIQVGELGPDSIQFESDAVDLSRDHKFPGFQSDAKGDG
jgi:hypothetical protein